MITSQRDTPMRPVFVASPSLNEQRLAKGIGVSGGALCGRAVFNLAQIRQWREQEPDTPLILIRSDTVPDDIREIARTEGLLTAKGGQTSHAAIVAVRLCKICVVGCPTLYLDEEAGCGFIAGRKIVSGAFVGIDGYSGLVVAGQHAVAPSLR
jgi:pyruvate,orthophosphate dikinase